MRYSMLVYLANMGKTLLEAARYLRTVEDSPLKNELLENGRQMLGQIRHELERHSGSLRSALPLEQLRNIRKLWNEAGTGDELEKTLSEFTRCLPEEVSYQIRAVFFAELGEKWDSLESVYMSMRDDPRFDPVVVRTPVFRETYQGGKKVRETIYKDFLTPLGVPSLEHSQYSLEEDCPDLAFISQPYESCTLREFWPETISKFTRLVYLPYFLPTLIQKDTMEALCQIPVYRYAWKVIGSNQKHLRYYQEHTVYNGANMLLTGLPKLDPIVNAREKCVELPSLWKKLSGKKVFLWNTWYDIRLSSFRFFDEVFHWFQGRDDCALIWRPHPMTEVVTKMYFPNLYPHFQQCIQEINNSSNCILDRESSFLAAFVFSDAQISDQSSMMQQYLLMDKPLLWLEIKALGATGDAFVSPRWMEQADSAAGIIHFMEQVRRGEDGSASLRASVRQEDLPLADGRCGERVCKELWRSMHQEDLGADLTVADMTDLRGVG